jgi:hypothetical protein
VPVFASGESLDQLFAPELLSGGYRKKYYRALSRLVALANEAESGPEAAPKADAPPADSAPAGAQGTDSAQAGAHGTDSAQAEAHRSDTPQAPREAPGASR